MKVIALTHVIGVDSSKGAIVMIEANKEDFILDFLNDTRVYNNKLQSIKETYQDGEVYLSFGAELDLKEAYKQAIDRMLKILPEEEHVKFMQHAVGKALENVK